MVLLIANNHDPLAPRRSTKVVSVDLHWTDRFEVVQLRKRGVESLLRLSNQESGYVFHYEESRLQFPHNSTEVPNHLVSGVAQISPSNETESLTWRSSNHSRQITFLQIGFLSYLGSADLRNVGVQQSRCWKILFERTCEFFVDVNRQRGMKPGSVGTE